MAVPVEREADDVRGVVVPAGIDGVAHDVADLREHVFDQGLVPAERDPLAQVGRHAHHQALAGARHPAQLLVLAPALQLSQHGLQLEVPRLLVQQAVVLLGDEARYRTPWTLCGCVLSAVSGLMSNKSPNNNETVYI